MVLNSDAQPNVVLLFLINCNSSLYLTLLLQGGVVSPSATLAKSTKDDISLLVRCRFILRIARRLYLEINL